VFVNNGLVFYAAWITVAASLNLAIAVSYEWAPNDISDQTSSSLVSLGILNGILLIYFFLEIYVVERQLRYTFSHYIQLAIAFIGLFFFYLFVT
jgi:hypothetical protein